MIDILIRLTSLFGPAILIGAITVFAIWKLFGKVIKSQKDQIKTQSDDIKLIRSELKERRKEAAEEWQKSKNYRKKIDSLSAKLQALQNDFDKQQKQVSNLVKEIGALSKQVTSIKLEHAETIEKINNLASSIAEFTHYLEHTKSIDSNILDKFEETLNRYGSELVRINELVQQLHPTSETVHAAVISAFDEGNELVSAEGLETVLQNMVIGEDENS